MANSQPTTGTGSGIGNKKKKKENKTPKEDDRDDDDEPTSPPQTLKADKKKTSKESDSAGEEETGDSLVIGGLNVRSLLTTNAAEEQKKNLVGELIDKNKLDILVVGESMLRESTTPRRQEITSDPLHIDGYIYVRQDRYFINENASGGLVVYIREEIEFKKRSDWEWPESNVQFVEISITEPARFDLVAIYSPNKTHRQYVINLMRFFLERNKDLQVPVMFVGDLNIDFGNDAKASEAFTEFKAQFGARKLITDETRLKRCIDHIIIAIPEQEMGSVDAKVVKTVNESQDSGYISDHQLVLCSVKKSPQPATFSISQPKKCDDIILQDVLSVLIKDSQTKHISLKMICEFNSAVSTDNVKPSSYIKMSKISDHPSVSFDVTLTAPNEVVKRLGEVDILITEIKDNNDQAPVDTLQCTICIVHKQTKSLHISDESKPWSVGGVDCFLINCSANQIPKVEPFLRKFHVCDQTDCFELFRTEPNVRHHKMLKHFYCPYCLIAPKQNLKKLGKHIKKKHLYICDREDCMELFSNEKELKEHDETHPKYVNENLNHGDNECKKCDVKVSYANREQLTYHYASKHFICIQCSVKLSSKQCTMDHLATQHFITWCPDKCCSKYFGPNEDMLAHQRALHHY